MVNAELLAAEKDHGYGARVPARAKRVPWSENKRRRCTPWVDTRSSPQTRNANSELTKYFFRLHEPPLRSDDDSASVASTDSGLPRTRVGVPARPMLRLRLGGGADASWSDRGSCGSFGGSLGGSGGGSSGGSGGGSLGGSGGGSVRGRTGMLGELAVLRSALAEEIRGVQISGISLLANVRGSR